MSAVYVNNIVINVGADFSQTFFLEGTATNSALDLSGYTVSAQMRKWSGSSTAITFTTEKPFPQTSGTLTLSLTSVQTSSIKSGRYVYDVIITDSNSIKSRVIEGMVLVREGVTR
jgi:hypothetical protein|tara:strand:+ start:311 stop:655 length:345 start_codon:yes stop_codon:yes gene_type:complete